MATLTAEQARKKQALCPEGWRFDEYRFVAFNDSVTRRYIDLEDNKYICATVEYTKEYERKNNGYCSFNVATGKVLPTLNISEWTKNTETGCAVSHGLGKSVVLGAPEDRKVYKTLCKYAATVSDDLIMQIYTENLAQLRDGRIM